MGPFARRSSLADLSLLIASFSLLAVVGLGLAAQVRGVQLWLLLFGLAAGSALCARALLSRVLSPLADLGIVLVRRREQRLPFLAETPRFSPFEDLAALAIELSARETEATSQAAAATVSAGGDRSTFLRAVSHELRTPLNAILGFTDVLQNELDGPITSEQRENLAVIRASTEKLAYIVNDMIDVAQLAASDAARPRTKFEVSALLEAVRESVEERRGMRPVHVRVAVREGAEQITAEREGLARALRILAEHAIEATDSGEVALLCEAGQGEVLLRVQGDGLARESVELSALLREPTNPDRKHKSTLLRLAIARELLTLQGGRIDLADMAEGALGAVILVHLPQRDEEVA